MTAVGPRVQVRHEFFVFRQGKQPKGPSRATSDHKLFPVGRQQLTTEFPREGRPSLSIDSRLGLTYEQRRTHTSLHTDLGHFTTTHTKSTIFSHFCKKTPRFWHRKAYKKHTSTCGPALYYYTLVQWSKMKSTIQVTDAKHKILRPSRFFIFANKL